MVTRQQESVHSRWFFFFFFFSFFLNERARLVIKEKKPEKQKSRLV
jgi:hypothetical protein